MDDAPNLQAFLASTSGHGLAKILLKDKFGRRIWMVICLVCYIATLATVALIISDAMDPGNIMTKVTMKNVKQSKSS